MFSQLKLAIRLILGFIQFLKLGIYQLAIFHCNVKVHSRLHDSSNHAVRSAAYRAGTILVDATSGHTYNYSRKSEVIYSEILSPDNTPENLSDRATLWSTVEKSENRVDAQLFREVEVALPIEGNPDSWKKLLRKYIKKNFVSKGMIADVSIHNNPGNPHAHIMLTLRDIKNDGFGNKNRGWNDKKLLESWRKGWEVEVNESLKDLQLETRVSHKSLKDQGVDRLPMVHEGREGIGGQNKHKVEARRQHNRRIRDTNRTRSELKKFEAESAQIHARIKELDAEIEELSKPEIIESNDITPTSVGIPPRTTTPVNTDVQSKVTPAISRSYSLAPSDLLNKTYEILINSRPAPEQSASVRKTISALPEHCIDLRLPNGKIIYPESKEALKQAIEAWSLSPKESENLEAKFWSLVTPEYYNHGIRSILNKNASTIDPNILDCFTKQELKHYKSCGVSPKSIIEYALQRKEYFGPDKEIKVWHRGVKKSVERCKDFYVILKRESVAEQIELNKQYWKSIDLKQYCLEVFDSGMSFGFKPENFDPLNIIKNHLSSFNPRDYAEAIYQRTKKTEIETPRAIRRILTRTSSMKDYDKIRSHAEKRNFTSGDFEKLLIPWWSQFGYQEYYAETKRLFIEAGRLQAFERLTYEQIEDALYNKIAPVDFANSVGVGTGTGTGGYEPEEDFRQTTPYQKANHLYDTPTPSKPSGYGGSSTPKPW